MAGEKRVSSWTNVVFQCVIVAAAGMTQEFSGSVPCARVCLPYRADTLPDGGCGRIDGKLLERDYVQFGAESIEQFISSEQEVRVARAPKVFVTLGESCVDKHTIVREIVD